MIQFTSPACTPGSASGPTLGNEYGKTLPLPYTPRTSRLRKLVRVCLAVISLTEIHTVRIKCRIMPPLTLLVGCQEGHPACKKREWWSAGVVICLGRGADLHMAQLIPLPPAVSCSSKIQIGLPFWYWLTWVVPDKGPLSGCMYVCMYVFLKCRIKPPCLMNSAGALVRRRQGSAKGGRCER